ncbi:biotin-dependent carboxyltransferase family protein [Pseudalkalibacillus salsuginis]|uniref:5-oxoprolinase subunit C family protein n=1 Tax=Pseudalkalibacillus salsuginis TaxID=2910972 RepID=UPI001F180F31|nr:biotin-dependent carboxyltransferase family protein [Pseudalkalibacillus salsuginis]MCF6412024.1 biotin-dependent carboxyltransferase family protein [Pseudalkalibacillus salsuginis]
MINVKEPGLMTTVQDNGRNGYYSFGMPPSGAMDKYSFIVANLLVGNDENAAVLEATYLGPTLEFDCETTIAVTGGEIPPKLNGEPFGLWKPVHVEKGDVLSFNFVKSGTRVYIAVAGGIDVPIKMGSRSTYTLCGIGGFEGRALQKGDLLKTGEASNPPASTEITLSEELIPKYGNRHEIRVIMGLCSYRLTEESKKKFFDIEWTVTPDANRVGYRFKGEPLEFVEREQPFGAGSDPSNVTDLGYPIGSIQIPAGIEPIALLNDAVTGGGYATIATIISIDLFKMGQIKSNDKVKFIEVSLDEAIEARKELNGKLDKVKETIKTVSIGG